MISRHVLLALALLSCASVEVSPRAAAGAAARSKPGKISFLDNGRIRLGVSLDVGGAITHLSKSGDASENLVNNWDWGRQVQMSHYSGPVPFVPAGATVAPEWKRLGWNPVQAGDAFRNASKVVEHGNDGKTITIRCVPMQWPLNNVPSECEFRTKITLEENTARVECTLSSKRSDRRQYPARGQELPAVYTIGKLHRLMTYRGDKPCTGDEVTRVEKKQPHASGMPIWDYWTATENWGALVGDDGFGVGVWNGAAMDFCGGFHGKEGAGGSYDDPTGYIAPTGSHVIDHDIEFRYSYVLIVGTVDEIRQFAVDHAPPRKKGEGPRWRFDRDDRQGWHYVNATDAGWPVRGKLHVRLNGDDPQIIAPTTFWHADDALNLRIEAAFQTADPNAAVYFRRFGDATFAHGKHVAFAVKGDGRYRTYEVDLASSHEYRGPMIGLRIDPTATGNPGEWVKIRSIELAR